mmetsp:Transcript_41348/g.70787  ORF Transcript_41348/g.70787 Transcript_41348/m.70787 type:complete len:483 (-) Transcript_41348:176-1624(-)
MSLCNKRKVLTIKAFSSGEAKPVATKMAIIPDPDKITLRALIDQKIRQAAPSFAFSTSTILHISRVVATDKDQTDVFDFLDFPTSILLEQLEAKHPGIAVTIGTAAPSQDNDPCKDANNTSNNADNNQPRNTSRTPSRLASGENSVLNNIEPEGVIPNHDGNCESESEGVESYGPALLSNSSNGNHSINDDDTSDDVVGSECVVGCNSDEDNGIFEEENNSFDEDEGDDNDVSSTYSGNPSSSIDSKGGIGDLSSIPSTNESNESGHASNVLEYGLCKSSNANGDETIGAISNVTPMDVLQTLVVNAFAVYRAMNPQEPMRFDPSSPIPLLPVSVCGTNIMDSISVMTPNSVSICETEDSIRDCEHCQEICAPDIGCRQWVCKCTSETMDSEPHPQIVVVSVSVSVSVSGENEEIAEYRGLERSIDEYEGMKRSTGTKAIYRRKVNQRHQRRLHRNRTKESRGYHRPTSKRTQRLTIINEFE